MSMKLTQLISIQQVLGLPFDVETEELKYYMRTYGELDDCIVMKDRMTGQSRGFGYVTFSTVEDATKAVSSQHVLNGRSLDVKIATPKDEMVPSASKKVSRIFVARIPPHVTEGMFRSYFQKYGGIVDAYMPKDAGSRSHRGIGFVTFDNAESVDRIMNETHELGGSLVAVDRATPKDETLKGFGGRPQYDQAGRQPDQSAKALPDQWAKMAPEQFGFYMAAAAAAMAQMGALGGSMEGVDLASYGFPGFTAPGGADNASEVEAAKNAGAQANDPSGGAAEASQEPPSSATGYATQGSAPENTSAAASGYETEAAAQNNAASAYGPAALFNSMYSMFSGYGANPVTSSIPSAVYGSASHGSGPGGMNFPAGYGQSAEYSTAAAAPGYYNAAAGDAAAQAYVYDQGSGTLASGAYTYGGSGVPGQGYDSGVSYAAPEVPNYGYGGSASYAGAAPTSGAGHASNMYDQAAGRYAPSNPHASTMGNKVFVGKLPHEATAEHLRNYFSSFGRIADVYVPKDLKKTGHRGFGFVTFFDDGVAEQVALQSHEILGQPVAVDRPTPLDSTANTSYTGNFASQSGVGDASSWGNAAELQRNYEYASARLGFFAGGQPGNPYDGAAGADRVSRPSDYRFN
ncbi:hypothetical protein GOP47_0019545 [Adiantum capillus-veneris]|uniref:RRM domain-containing protein n=1 Tax=Adiantum capillus-veneris TaxID=13818 RepID=A0A9D4UBI1_ADICA|nr:hypothetical protein GOP47_0019545 [Adiantum capillus-veneris]